MLPFPACGFVAHCYASDREIGDGSGRPRWNGANCAPTSCASSARADAIVILPVASLEQHGPHLPVEVDTMLGETVAVRAARKIAERGQQALVLPVLWTGLSEHHMSFGGTITLDFPAFAAVVEGVCRSVLRHGFKRIVLLNAHGGNENALRTITDELTPKLGAPIVQFTYWYAAAVAIAKILETQGALMHACEAETSMMMAVRPELVAMDRIGMAKANSTPDVGDVVGGGVYRWRTIGARSVVRRDRQSRGGDRGEGRAAVRGDRHRARGQAVQRGAVGVAVAGLSVIASERSDAAIPIERALDGDCRVASLLAMTGAEKELNLMTSGQMAVLDRSRRHVHRHRRTPSGWARSPPTSCSARIPAAIATPPSPASRPCSACRSMRRSRPAWWRR